MEKFYDGSLIYDCLSDEDDIIRFSEENMQSGWKCFIAIFDPEVSAGNMREEIIEAVKCSV